MKFSLQRVYRVSACFPKDVTNGVTLLAMTDQQRILKSQYHASLAMLRQGIEACPDDLWLREAKNPFWKLSYHTLYFTHMYLQRNFESFVPWESHRAGPNKMDETGGGPYTKAEILAYWVVCDQMVDAALGKLDLSSSESGFSWYPVSKLEHQIISIRHIQHHAAQLADRLRAAIDFGMRWVGSAEVK
jgi:hypothetical protein